MRNKKMDKYMNGIVNVIGAIYNNENGVESKKI